MPLSGSLKLLLTACAICTILAAPARAQSCPTVAVGSYPANGWRTISHIDHAWNDDGLATAFSTAERHSYAAGMLIYRGQVIRRFGGLSRRFDLPGIWDSLPRLADNSERPTIGRAQLVVARSIGMQDFPPNQLRQSLSDAAPQFSNELSTRDRARLGLLILSQGCWGSRRVLNGGSANPDMRAAGGKNWLHTTVPGFSERVILWRGEGEQIIALLPNLDAVLVLTTDLNAPAWLNSVRRGLGLLPAQNAYWAVLRHLVAAKRGGVRRRAHPFR